MSTTRWLIVYIPGFCFQIYLAARDGLLDQLRLRLDSYGKKKNGNYDNGLTGSDLIDWKWISQEIIQDNPDLSLLK